MYPQTEVALREYRLARQNDRLTMPEWRAVSEVYPPYSYDCFETFPTNCSRPGIEAEYLAVILKLVNISVAFKVNF